MLFKLAGFASKIFGVGKWSAALIFISRVGFGRIGLDFIGAGLNSPPAGYRHRAIRGRREAGNFGRTHDYAILEKNFTLRYL